MPVSIFSRYYENGTIKAPRSTGGKVVTSLTLRLPEMTPEFPDSIIHTVIGGETLDELSFRYYGREDLWWRILDANELYPDSGSDPRTFRLQSGDRLIVPPARMATRFPRG